MCGVIYDTPNKEVDRVEWSKTLRRLNAHESKRCRAARRGADGKLLPAEPGADGSVMVPTSAAAAAAAARPQPPRRAAPKPMEQSQAEKDWAVLGSIEDLLRAPQPGAPSTHGSRAAQATLTSAGISLDAALMSNFSGNGSGNGGIGSGSGSSSGSGNGSGSGANFAGGHFAFGKVMQGRPRSWEVLPRGTAGGMGGRGGTTADRLNETRNLIRVGSWGDLPDGGVDSQARRRRLSRHQSADSLVGRSRRHLSKHRSADSIMGGSQGAPGARSSLSRNSSGSSLRGAGGHISPGGTRSLSRPASADSWGRMVGWQQAHHQHDGVGEDSSDRYLFISLDSMTESFTIFNAYIKL